MLLSNYNHVTYSYLIQQQHEMYKKKRHTITQYSMAEPCLIIIMVTSIIWPPH